MGNRCAANTRPCINRKIEIGGTQGNGMVGFITKYKCNYSTW